jgi:glycerol kinase
MRRGVAVADAQQEFMQQLYPQAGWVEQDADEIWATTLATWCARALAEAGRLDAADHRRSASANQRETTVLWERDSGRPIHRAIVWQDRRTADVCERLRAAGHEDRVAAKTGLLLDPYFSATKIAWTLDQVPDARARAAAWRTLLRHHRQLVVVEAHRRTHLRDRCDQRLAHPVVRHAERSAGGTTTCCAAVRCAARAAARGARLERRLWPDVDRVLVRSPQCRSAACSAISRRRWSARPVFAPGMIKSTYGTGCFMRDEHRR